MRLGRVVQDGRAQSSLTFGGNIFARQLASNAALATDQTPALKLANQLNYANPNYTYNGSPAPSFYGYPSSGPAAGNANMGYGGNINGFQTTLNFASFNVALYVVDSSVSTQKITLVNYSNATTYTTAGAGASHNLQASFNAVPVPDPAQLQSGYSGQLWPNGTDRHVVIWRPSTNELWEMWRMYGSSGSYIFGNGGYTASANTFSGIWPFTWGARATSLALTGGLVTIQDIVDSLNGVPIRHALGITASVTSLNSSYFAAPATRADGSPVSFAPAKQVDGTTDNPAYTTSNPNGNGFIDAVPEGTWLRFPANFDPVASMPSSGPVARALATAVRDYGMFVMDAGGATCMFMEDPRVLGSPYSYAKVNPFASGPSNYNAYINNSVPAGWADATLPTITEIMSGTTSVLSKIPWQQLQVLQPFSS
jgi:hypothetical protein